MLGPFSVMSGDREAGPWPRPSARRLCELVLVSPGRRVSRDLACEELFPDLAPRAAARALSKALSMARGALSALGDPASALLTADSQHIWASMSAEVDAETQASALRDALSMPPGRDRDERLAAALAEDGALLANEPYVDWAIHPRERLETLRQDARLALARDRAKGAGRSRPEAVIEAWEACFEHDQACEEAAGALIRAYVARGRRPLAVRAYERCTAALEDLGLPVSPWLREEYAAVVTPPRSLATESSGRGDLRTVSVLVAEVTVPAGLDPERLRDIAAESLAAVITEAEALGGTVTSVSGGGAQAVFGAPEAHEDDPERAVRAAFRAVTSVADPGTLRIGVETGLAVLGPVGTGGKVAYGAMGEVVRLAGALQASATPGSILVGPATRAATANLFSWGASQEVSGDMVATYLGGPAIPRVRLSSRGLLVGRRAELGILGTALREMVAGRGSVVVVTGEPGLGKTRLVQEARRRFKLPAWLEGRCVSYGSATPYGLYRQVLANWIGLAPDMPEAAVRPALEKALDAESFAPLARMMGFPAAGGQLSPGDQRRAIFAAWHRLISRLTAAGPAVLVLEDLHWADNTSLQLTLDLAGLAAERRLLVLATSRPETASEIGRLGRVRPTGPRVHRIRLDPLPAQAERELARHLLGGEVDDAVLATAEGNPLFLQERLSSLLEAGALLCDRGVWHLAKTAEPEVPQVLERLVLSRVDRLSPAAREVARRAAVLGVQFSLSLLTAVCEVDEPPIAALDEMRAKDLLREVPGVPERVFRFRHALIQEAIYHGLLGPERRVLHGRVAWELEAASAGRREEVAAVLGRHFAAAGENSLALRYLEMAGDHATDAYANDEAISSYRAALDIVGESGVGVRLLAKLANVLWRTARHDEARSAFQEALRVGTTDPVLTAHLQTRLGRLERAVHHFDAAEAAFDAAEAALGEPHGETAVEHWLEMMVDGRAGLYLCRNEPERALAGLRAARSALEAHGSPARRYSYYQFLALSRVMERRYRASDADIATMRQSLSAARGSEEKDIGYATSDLGRLLWLRGDLPAAQEHHELALAMAERIGETYLLGMSLLGLAHIAVSRHDAAALRVLEPRLLAAGEDMGSADLVTAARACRAWLAWQDGRTGEVLAQAEKIAELRETVVQDAHRWIGLLPMTAVYLDAGKIADAVSAASETLHPSQQMLSEQLEALVRSAVAAWERGDAEATRETLEAALALARDLGFI
jgi:DNA-binding SARP family transcriptional activator